MARRLRGSTLFEWSCDLRSCKAVLGRKRAASETEMAMLWRWKPRPAVSASQYSIQSDVEPQLPATALG